MQRERPATLLVTGGNPKHLRRYSLLSRLLCATGTHNTIGKGAWRIKPCQHKRTQLLIHRTDKTQFRVGGLFSNKKSCSRKKTCKIIDWFKPNLEASERGFIATMWVMCGTMQLQKAVFYYNRFYWQNTKLETFWIIHRLVVATAPSKPGHLSLSLLENLADYVVSYDSHSLKPAKWTLQEPFSPQQPKQAFRNNKALSLNSSTFQKVQSFTEENRI